MKKLLTEYRDFIKGTNVVVTAVGLVMALYVKDIVDAIIDAIINPIIALIFGEPNYREIGFTIDTTFFSIGLVIDAIITFLIVAVVLFLILKGYNKYVDKPKAEEGEPPLSELDVLTQIRDELRSR